MNEYEKPKRVQPGGTASRVVRGGSWISPHDGARAGYRGHNHPDFRYVNIGFRLVCAAPIR